MGLFYGEEILAFGKECAVVDVCPAGFGVDGNSSVALHCYSEVIDTGCYPCTGNTYNNGSSKFCDECGGYLTERYDCEGFVLGAAGCSSTLLCPAGSGTNGGTEATAKCQDITDYGYGCMSCVGNTWNDGSSDLCMSCDGFLSALYGHYCQNPVGQYYQDVALAYLEASACVKVTTCPVGFGTNGDMTPGMSCDRDSQGDGIYII